MLRGILPSTILSRPKKGFNMPVARWLAGPLRELLHDTLAERRLRAEGIFDPAYVGKLLVDHDARRADRRKELWTLLVFELWHQQLQRAPMTAVDRAGPVCL